MRCSGYEGRGQELKLQAPLVIRASKPALHYARIWMGTRKSTLITLMMS